MKLAVDAVLAQRSRQVAASSRPRLGGSLIVHLLLAGAAVVAPLLAAQSEHTPPEFVPVFVVPAQALGIREPVPTPSRPQPQPAQPEPAPEETPPPAEEREPDPEPALAPPEPAPRIKPPAPAREPTPPGPRGGELGRRQGSPTGSSSATSPFGGASFDFADQNFTYGYYVDQMLAMIYAQWNRPSLGAQVEAAVFYRIKRDGTITDLRIVESSGFNVFDLAGLRAVRQAAPFPRLPVSYPRSSLAVKLILR